MTDNVASPTQSPTTGRKRAIEFLRGLLPVQQHVSAVERARAMCGAALGIFVTALVCKAASAIIPVAATPWLFAALGASAVLVFAVPSSPLAQPWSVVAGQFVSSLSGIACAVWIGDSAWAAGVAVGLAVASMFALRCLHPPGGGTALLMVLAHITRFDFAVFPVLANVVVLVALGMAYNTITGRRYPHTSSPAAATDSTQPSRFTGADLDAAMAHFKQVLTVDRTDLTELLHHAELAAYERNLGTLRCADIMSTKPVTAEFGTPLDEAWALMRERGIKALPVVDKALHIVGIITLADFMRHAGLDEREGIGERVRALVQRDGAQRSEKPEVVGQIMTRRVRVAGRQSLVIDLVPLFSEGGHHHIPIIDEDKHLVGIITQSDLVSALFRVVRRPG